MFVTFLFFFIHVSVKFCSYIYGTTRFVLVFQPLLQVTTPDTRFVGQYEKSVCVTTLTAFIFVCSLKRKSAH